MGQSDDVPLGSDKHREIQLVLTAGNVRFLDFVDSRREEPHTTGQWEDVPRSNSFLSLLLRDYMRHFVALLSVLGCAMFTFSQSPSRSLLGRAEADRPNFLQRVRNAPSERARIAFDTLDIFVITNDDPFLIGDQPIATLEYVQQKTIESKESIAKRDVWCAEVVESSINEILVRRTDLEHTLVLQTIAAGLPSFITGGQPLGEPGRAIVAICDVEGRLLSLGIGVPEPDELLLMVEDADETRAMFDRNSDPQELLSLVTGRSR